MGLAIVEILMGIEDHFGIVLPEEQGTKCITVADLQAEIVNLLVQKGRQRSTQLQAEVYSDLVKIIVDQMGIKPADVSPESRWIGDITKYG
jgi:acyl carrier protein